MSSESDLTWIAFLGGGVNNVASVLVILKVSLYSEALCNFSSDFLFYDNNFPLKLKSSSHNPSFQQGQCVLLLQNSVFHKPSQSLGLGIICEHYCFFCFSIYCAFSTTFWWAIVQSCNRLLVVELVSYFLNCMNVNENVHENSFMSLLVKLRYKFECKKICTTGLSWQGFWIWLTLIRYILLCKLSYKEKCVQIYTRDSS